MRTATALVGASLAFFVYRILNAFISRRRAAAAAKHLGCEEAPRQIHALPLGIDHVHKSLKADREQCFPEFLTQRFERMGAWTFSDSSLGSARRYVTCDPKNIQAVLATQFHDFEIGMLRKANFAPMFGVGIFTQDGKAWEHSRAMLRPQFAREQVSDLELEENHVQNMMRALPITSHGWTDTVDLQVLFFRLTLDSATEFLFGESVDSQLAELPAEVGRLTGRSPTQTEKVFANAFDVGQRWLATRVRFDHWYWLVTGKEFRTACKQTHEFADHFVRLALDDQRKEKRPAKGGKEKYVFLDALAAETRDPIELRSQLLNILLAGRDSTASLLGWLFYILARDPRLFGKLRETVIDAFGTYDDSREITFTRLKACHYLQYCINETLRIYPVVPVNARMAVRDTTLPRGGGPDHQAPIFVRQGEGVVYCVHAMHHRKDLWGVDADEFKPERWQGIKPSWNYLPFNGGPRICLGRKRLIRPDHLIQTSDCIRS